MHSAASSMHHSFRKLLALAEVTGDIAIDVHCRSYQRHRNCLSLTAEKCGLAFRTCSRDVGEHSRQLRWLTHRSEDACTLHLSPELKGVVLEANLTTLFYQSPCVTDP